MKSGAYILCGKGEFYSITSIIHCYTFHIRFWEEFKIRTDLEAPFYIFHILSDYEINKHM